MVDHCTQSARGLLALADDVLGDRKAAVAAEILRRRRQTRAEKWKRKYGWLGGTLAALWLTSRGFG
jgi:hypothetical protein